MNTNIIKMKNYYKIERSFTIKNENGTRVNDMEVDGIFLSILLEITIIFLIAAFWYFQIIYGKATENRLEKASIGIDKKLQTLPATLKKQIQASLEDLDWEEIIQDLRLPGSEGSTFGQIAQGLPWLVQAYQMYKQGKVTVKDLVDVGTKAATETIKDTNREE